MPLAATTAAAAVNPPNAAICPVVNPGIVPFTIISGSTVSPTEPTPETLIFGTLFHPPGGSTGLDPMSTVTFPVCAYCVPGACGPAAISAPSAMAFNSA